MSGPHKIYRHINKINGKRYIGQTSQPGDWRYGKNGQRYCTCKVFYNAIQKYGWDAFEHTVLMTDLTQEEADLFEKYLIEEFRTTDHEFGYNFSKGGTFGFRCDHLSEEHKRKIGDAHRGIRNANYGKHLSEERRTAMSILNKNRSDQSIRVICTDTNIEYPSIAEASRQTGLDGTIILNCCRYRVKHAKGTHWRYADDELDKKYHRTFKSVKAETYEGRMPYCMFDVTTSGYFFFDSLTEVSQKMGLGNRGTYLSKYNEKMYFGKYRFFPMIEPFGTDHTYHKPEEQIPLSERLKGNKRHRMSAYITDTNTGIIVYCHSRKEVATYLKCDYGKLSRFVDKTKLIRNRYKVTSSFPETS